MITTLVLLVGMIPLWAQPASEQVKLNDIQVIGSHNSYKIAIEKSLFDHLLSRKPELKGLEYEHIPLSEQLDLGLRSLELDVFHDPEGGYYSGPKGLEIVRGMGKEPEPFDSDQTLEKPGLKVFHIQEVDFRSHQLLFQDALVEVKEWSDSHEGHTPIIITINTKDGQIPDTRNPLPFDGPAYQNLNDEIQAVFPEERLITPDMVRGDYNSLDEAVRKKGWPELSAVHNRFLFVLDENREKTDRYLEVFPKLKGAVLFVNVEENQPEAGFRIINDPVKQFDKIKALVEAGYLVRTRADANTREAREHDYSRFEKAKASGAQVITTDYYLPGTLFESSFQVRFEDGTYERVRQK